MASGNKDVRLKMSLDTSDAVKSLRDFEKQADKLGNLADQGEKLQGGFLSRKQVQTYRGILSDMESTYTRYKQNLTQIDRRYEQLQRSEDMRQLRQLENNLKKRQELYNKSMGNNRWGDVASPKIQEYHRSQVGVAEKQLSAHQDSATLKQILQELKELESSRNALATTVQNLDMQNNRAQGYANRINNLYERNPRNERMANAASTALSATGVVTSIGGYVSYTSTGIDMLRDQERSSQNVTQRLNSYFGVNAADSQHRESIQSMGESLGYNVGDVALVQQAQLNGGNAGDVTKFNSDTEALLKTSRSLALDPSSMAEETSAIKRLGAMEEGDMQKFANILAGAIQKTGASGREAEMLRSTTALLENVAQGQAELSSKAMSNVVGLQTAMGEAVPELKGERGAALLSSIDSNIKNGSPQLDLLMGKGTEFIGVEGMAKLEELKEQGIANPENLQRIFNNADRMFNGNESLIKFTLKEQLGLQMSEYNALKKGGFIDRIKAGDMPTAEELQQAGITDLAEKWGKYDSSETGRLNSLDAQGQNLQADHAKAADEVAKDSRGLWHSLPDWMQHTLLPAAAAGGAAASVLKGRALARGAARMMGRNIGGGSGGGFRGLFSSGAGAADDVARARAGAGAAQTGGRLLSGTANYGDDLLRSSGNMFNGFAKSAAKKLPIIGGGVTVGVDRLENPENDWGRSLAKGVGSVVGSILGGAAAIGLGVGTGGVGLLTTGAAATGGATVGESAGDWLYSLFNGEEDKKKADEESAQPQNTSTAGAETPTQEASEGTLTVGKLMVNDKDLAALFETGKASGTEMNVNINVNGSIDGMTKDNQDEVADSIKDFFKKSITSNLFGSSGLNLANDQYRT